MESNGMEVQTWTAHTVGPHTPDSPASAPRENPGLLDVARVHRAGQGEPQAQTWLLTRVLPRVRRIARTFLSSPADADDAAQIALLEILGSAATFRGEAGVEGWAGRIAVRATLRYIATERRGRKLVTPEADADLEEPEAPASARSSEALPRHVREYLGELPEAQSSVILLHHALDHSVDEIAELTCVSPDTVKSRLRLGLSALRKRIRQDLAIGRRRSS